MVSSSSMRVLHIVSGDVWAGLEAQAFTLLLQLAPQVQLRVILFNEGELAQRLRAVGITPIILCESRLSGLQLAVQLFKHLRAFKPHILHAHRQKEQVLAGAAKAVYRLLGGRVQAVRTLHGAPEFAPHFKQKIQHLFENITAKSGFQAMIAVSQALSLQLQPRFSATPFYVIENGVDINALKALVQPVDWGVPQDCFHVGIIGRLQPVKRVDLFLQMAALLVQAANPAAPWHFHIIGSGPLAPSLQALAKTLGIHKWVSFHGHRTDIPACIAHLNAVVMCSDHEGTPMTALETLALGVPLVAHNVGGLQAILQDYPDLKVHQHTPEAYAQRLQWLRSVQPAPQIALNPIYSAYENSRKTLGLYGELLGKNGVE